MHRRYLLLSAILFAQLANSQPETPAPDSTLEVRVTYAGAGVVDSSHKLYVMLWDTPDFAKDDSKLKPLDAKAITAQTGSVQFTKIKKNPVYISMAYDPQGGYAGQVPAPAGTFADTLLPTPFEIAETAGVSTPVARLTPMDPARGLVSSLTAGIGWVTCCWLPTPYSANTELVNPEGMTTVT